MTNLAGWALGVGADGDSGEFRRSLDGIYRIFRMGPKHAHSPSCTILFILSLAFQKLVR